VGERQLLVGRKMKVGKDHLAFLDAGPLDLDRLLDLHDQVGLAPNRVGIGADFCADRRVGRIRKAASLAGPLLDHDAVTRCHQRFSACRHQSDPILVGLDLLRKADLHK
jgi:hypothetical protein